jgi:hypothetical protein
MLRSHQQCVFMINAQQIQPTRQHTRELTLLLGNLRQQQQTQLGLAVARTTQGNLLAASSQLWQLNSKHHPPIPCQKAKLSTTAQQLAVQAHLCRCWQSAQLAVNLLQHCLELLFRHCVMRMQVAGLGGGALALDLARRLAACCGSTAHRLAKPAAAAAAAAALARVKVSCSAAHAPASLVDPESNKSLVSPKPPAKLPKV